ncbi:MAG: hypothetical protein A3F84_25360 [Candidatus Handelsmanbacteria bacterium RIFCSPLOWO2_12_FULL_64_10]|uniref:DUF5667 domain-containing protein n=1 Tax=Handelsmanbacteria sp. (strain RIFCSPLOWO2_12_FULL_64_10) TaxID=1817868 RepID=A0A1F6CT14_HANXR|nr:MAG: hypothetical protein A3F84_25360 [Candidatus Handelsmanbacteria bacterium RIFCSPLOWO2_12_FULL_64_10]
MRRGITPCAAFLIAGWIGLTDAQAPPDQEARTLPPEIQALQKKAVETRMEAQALELETARAQVRAAEANLTFTEALVKYTKELAEKDKKAKEWAKQTQKRLPLVRQGLESAKQRLDLILHPPADQANDPTLPTAQQPQQKPSERPPRMEDAGN